MTADIECLTNEHCKYIIGNIGSSTGCIAYDSELLHLLVQDLVITKSDNPKEYERYMEVIESLRHDSKID